jgi:hypothetical protein
LAGLAAANVPIRSSATLRPRIDGFPTHVEKPGCYVESLRNRRCADVAPQSCSISDLESTVPGGRRIDRVKWRGRTVGASNSGPHAPRILPRGPSACPLVAAPSARLCSWGSLASSSGSRQPRGNGRGWLVGPGPGGFFLASPGSRAFHGARDGAAHSAGGQSRDAGTFHWSFGTVLYAAERSTPQYPPCAVAAVAVCVCALLRVTCAALRQLASRCSCARFCSVLSSVMVRG